MPYIIPILLSIFSSYAGLSIGINDSLLFLKTLIFLREPDTLIPPAEYRAFKTVAKPPIRCGPGVLLSPRTVTFTGLSWVRETSKNDLWGIWISPENDFPRKELSLLFNELNV